MFVFVMLVYMPLKLCNYVFKFKIILTYPVLISKFRSSFSFIDSEG